jgi:glycosyltransferase involved in cell wall biosynthesis
MKIKVVGKDNVGWSIDKDRANLIYFLSKIEDVELTDRFFKADIYFFVWLDFLMSGKLFFFRLMKRLFWKNKKIIAWVTNDITLNKSFLKKKYPVDLFIAPSKRTSLFLEQAGLPHVTIPFFVSPELYVKKNILKEELLQKLNLPSELKEKFLIGSFQRDSEGNNLLSPKWQKNPDLLIEICKRLPKDSFCLVLAGPRRHYVVKRLQQESIPYVFVGDASYLKNKQDDIFVNNVSENIISDLYNLIDLYLVTSKSEGGPKAIFESALSKTLVFSTDVGLATDFLHPELIFSKDSIDELVSKIMTFMKGDSLDIFETYKNYNYDKVISVLNEPSYKNLIQKAVKSV